MDQRADKVKARGSRERGPKRRMGPTSSDEHEREYENEHENVHEHVHERERERAP